MLSLSNQKVARIVMARSALSSLSLCMIQTDSFFVILLILQFTIEINCPMNNSIILYGVVTIRGK